MARRKRRGGSPRRWVGDPAGRPRRPAPDLGTPPLIAEVRRRLATGRPLELLAYASGLIAAGEDRGSPLSGAPPAGPDLRTLVASFIDVSCRETTALLAAIAALTDDATLRRAIEAALGARQDTLPDWLADLRHAVAGGAAMVADPFGDVETLLAGLRLPGGEALTAVVVVDRNAGDAATDGLVVDADLDEVVRTAGTGDRADRIDAADARAHIEEAIELGATMFPPFETEVWPSSRPAVRWIARHLPAGGAGYARPEWSDRQLEALRRRFFASPHGRPLDDAERQDLLRDLFWFATGYGLGDPLRWSPASVGILLLDWIPRKIIADVEYLDEVPELLAALVRFAAIERDAPAPLAERTLAAVAALTDEYRTIIRTPRLQGPAALLGAVGAIDLDDPRHLSGADGAPSWMTDIDDLFRAELRDAVGGQQALDALDDLPLPDEPFEWDGVTPDVHEEVAAVLAATDACAAALLDIECRTAARRLLSRAARGDPGFFRRRGRPETAAAAVVWCVVRANDLHGRHGRLRAKDIAAHLGISPGSTGQRTGALLRAAGVLEHVGAGFGLGSPDFLIAERRRQIIRRRDELDAS